MMLTTSCKPLLERDRYVDLRVLKGDHNTKGNGRYYEGFSCIIKGSDFSLVDNLYCQDC